MVFRKLFGVSLVVILAGGLSGDPAADAQGLGLVGHFGGVSATQDLEGLEDLDWKTGVVDLALEGNVFGPLSLGIGGEVLFDAGDLDITAKEAGFAYAKVRVPLPLSPYAGIGAELRRASTFTIEGLDERDWHRGSLFLAGIGLKLVRVSLDLEFRYSRLEVGPSVLKLYSVRPGVSVWF